ncbi:MAG: ABC transporter substrate-binding protein [Candidatus Babeliales bacterium]|jgi:ABC-type branched-subunit amino acid transport system substrate-binding protein
MKMLNLMFLCLANINASAAIPQDPKNPTLFELQQSQPINNPLAPSITVTAQPINPLNYALPTRIISDKYELDICSSLPQTGEIAIIGDHLYTGMQAFLLKLKTLPGFNFYIKLDVRDDGGNITKTIKNINILNKKTPLLISLFGSNAMKCFSPYLKQNKIVSIFPIEGLEKWRNSSNKNSIFFRASDKAQITALIDYSINSLCEESFSVFYEASEWGEGVLTQIKNILNERGKKIIAFGSYPQKTVNVTSAVKKLSEYAKDTNAILCIAQARPTYNFIQQMINNGFIKTSFLCIDGLFSIQETLTKSRGITIITSSVVPDPFKSSLKIAKEYRADMKKYFPNKNLSPFSFEGYINAAILCECIKASQFPISANKLINTIENIKNFDIPLLKDLKLNFNPETRTLSNRVWINVGNGKEWEEWSSNIERA